MVAQRSPKPLVRVRILAQVPKITINIFMDIKNIRFAELDFSYDKEALKNEIFSLEQYAQPIPSIPTAHKPRLNNAHLMTDADWKKHEDDIKLHKVLLMKWHRMGLAYLPGNTNTIFNRPHQRAHKMDQEWLLRDDLQMPYIRQVIASLPIKQLHTVVMFTTKSKGMGLMHWDDVGNYYEKGGVGITLNVDDGNTPMRFREDLRLGTHETAIPDVRTYLFRDDCWHHIPPTVGRRVQLRISCIPEMESLEKMVVPESVIYVPNDRSMMVTHSDIDFNDESYLSYKVQ
jgi:hypothetical protein